VFLHHARRRLLALLTLTGAAVLATATGASAHTVLVSSNPAGGATLSAPPSTVRLTFNEDVRAPAYVVVTGPGGTRIDSGAAKILGETVTEQLRPGSAAGTYTIAYRVVSEDGHPIEAKLTYRLARAATATTPRPTAAATPAPATPAPVVAAPAAAVVPAEDGDNGHLLHILGGFAVVLVGVVALIYERLQRGRRSAEHSTAGE
jgi:methionine-rich copper-binding protein CopC